MIRFSFRRGIRFFEGQRSWTVCRLLPDGRIQLEDQNTELINLSRGEIHEKFTKCEFIVDRDSLNDDGSSCHLAVLRDLSTYPKKEQEGAIRREKYLSRLLREGPIKINPCELTERLKQLAEEFGDETPPSVSSIYRWNCRYKAGKDITSLVARNENKGRRMGITGEIAEIVDAAIEGVHMNIQKNPKMAVVERVQIMVEDRNRKSLDGTNLIAPSRSTIYRYLKSLNRYVVDTARDGRDLQKTKYRMVLGAVQVNHINERWEVDHTPIDLLVYCEKSDLPMGKPWLTAIIDRYSRMIMGIYISFQSPSADSVLQALIHAILPKEEFLKRYPDIKAMWPACGLPVELVCDNGMEFHSESIRKVCLELNIGLTYCAAKMPQQKGAIERFLRTANYNLIHRLPGTVFGNPKKRDEYASEENAAIGFETLVYLVTKWVVEIYNQSPHRALKTTPFNRWSKGMAESVIEYPASPQQLSVIAGKSTTRVLQHYGIELEGLKYNNMAIQDIRRSCGYDNKIDLDIKYFETDAGHIYVFHPLDKEYLRVDAIDHDYAAGLHRAEHQLIQKHLREQQVSVADITNLLRAKEELRILISKAVHSKKMRSRKKSAQLRGVDSNTPRGRINGGLSAEAIVTKMPALDPTENDDDLPTIKIVKKVLLRQKGEEDE